MRGSGYSDALGGDTRGSTRRFDHVAFRLELFEQLAIVGAVDLVIGTAEFALLLKLNLTLTQNIFQFRKTQNI